MSPNPTGPHWVYQAYDEGGLLLYIGCTRSVTNRWREHRGSSATWLPFFDHFVVRGPWPFAEARRIERAQINKLKPFFNETSDQIAERNRANRSRISYPTYREMGLIRYLAAKENAA